MEPSSQQTSSQNTFKTVAELQGQADMIRSTLQECILSYPRGDSTINNPTVTDLGVTRRNYPINPDSTHFTSATPGRSGDQLVRNIRCPGNNPGGANQANHAVMFGGNSGKFLPPAPDLFEEWQYYNGTDGVFFWTFTDKTDAFITSALTKLDENFSECEADVISGTNADLDSDSTYQCTTGTICFRVRMTTTGTAIWNGDIDNDESSC